MDSTTPIQPLLVGDAERALALSAALRERGIYITAIRPPTVPAGTARLRITFSAAHGEAEVVRLLVAFEAGLCACTSNNLASAPISCCCTVGACTAGSSRCWRTRLRLGAACRSSSCWVLVVCRLFLFCCSL